MSRVKCKDCRRKISRRAKACPFCGRPQHRALGCLLMPLIVVGVLVAGAIGLSGLLASLPDSPRAAQGPPGHAQTAQAGHMQWLPNRQAVEKAQEIGAARAAQILAATPVSTGPLPPYEEMADGGLRALVRDRFTPIDELLSMTLAIERVTGNGNVYFYSAIDKTQTIAGPMNDRQWGMFIAVVHVWPKEIILSRPYRDAEYGWIYHPAEGFGPGRWINGRLVMPSPPAVPYYVVGDPLAPGGPVPIRAECYQSAADEDILAFAKLVAEDSGIASPTIYFFDSRLTVEGDWPLDTSVEWVELVAKVEVADGVVTRWQPGLSYPEGEWREITP